MPNVKQQAKDFRVWQILFRYPEPNRYTVAEAAEILGMGASTVHEVVKRRGWQDAVYVPDNDKATGAYQPLDFSRESYHVR